MTKSIIAQLSLSKCISFQHYTEIHKTILQWPTTAVNIKHRAGVPSVCPA